MGLSVINWGGVTDSKLSETSKYPLQTDVATKEFQRIERLRASTSQYGLTKLSTANDITDINSHALSAVHNNPNVANTLASRVLNIENQLCQFPMQSFSEQTLLQQGWYRILYSKGNLLTMGIEFEVILHRTYGYNPTEYHRIKIVLFNNTPTIPTYIKSITSAAGYLTISKIRCVTVTGTSDFAVDVYYAGNTRGNGLIVQTKSYQSCTQFTNPHAIVPETPTDGTVTSELTLTANNFN